jgi:CYTH domain-containing protein
MAIEIERKFLVHGTDWCKPPCVPITQGYLIRDAVRSVRVRVQGELGFLTIKGPQKGLSRAEFEYEIPVADARALLPFCSGPLIQKVRHVLEYSGKTWEVDEFLGDNTGLVVAELELDREDETFERPQWLGKEVSQDARYLNGNLAACPFISWAERETDEPNRGGGSYDRTCSASVEQSVGSASLTPA